MKSARVVGHSLLMGILGVALMTGLFGCEVDSFFNPATVGRWERTPVAMPILKSLDVIDEADEFRMPRSQVQPSDLYPDIREYVIGPGDLVTVTVFELVQPGVESIQTRRVDETGVVRLPVIGPVKAAGTTPSQLERQIVEILERKGVLRDATVGVILQESRHNTFSIFGSPAEGETNFGSYVIPRPDFRLLDALALARGIAGRTKTLLIFRQSALTPEVAGEIAEESAIQGTEEAPAVPTDPSQLLEELEGAMEPGAGAEGDMGNTPEDRPAPPAGIERGLEGEGSPSQWVYVDGEWVRAGTAEGAAAEAPTDRAAQQAELDALGDLITQRIIEIPYERLENGDMRFNIVIRPGDVIRVPDVAAGFVYIMGEVNRPGAYTVPGENDLTLKQLIASAGGLGQIAIPERVDLVRRVGEDMEATVRLNVRAIFDGTEPDIFLKPNDLINVGTNFWATPIAVIRNGFRMSYGFGFVLDRNFNTDVFGN